jgi:hypothetical protein
VAEPERLLLAGEARLPGRGQVLLQFGQGVELVARLEGVLELELAVEMVLDDALVAPGDKDEVLDSGFPRLVDGVLDDGRSTTVSISLGMALVAGRKRVPSPATGKTAVRTRLGTKGLRFLREAGKVYLNT